MTEQQIFVASRRSAGSPAARRRALAAGVLAAALAGVLWGTEARAQTFDDADSDGLSDAADPCPADPRNFCYGVTAIDSATQLPVRLNAGAKQNVECSGARTDCAGHVWAADFGFSQVASTGVCDLFGGAESCFVTGIETLFGCSDESTEDLFQCEHFDRLAAPDLSYSFAVGDGDYLLNLFFADTFSKTATPGTRVFDVLAEGEVVLDDFDQVAAAGGSGVAIVRSVLVGVDDGVLDLQFGHNVQNPTVKAIELLKRVPCVTPEDCADGDLCNGIEVCESSFCAMGTAVVCASDEVCEPPTGICREKGGPCGDDTDCVGGELCNAATSLCRPRGGPCEGDADCVGEEACNPSAGECQPLGGRCEDDADCTSHEGCDQDTQKCRARGGTCQEDADCVAGEFCSGSTCAPCSSDDDCVGGGSCLICVEGACVDDSPCDGVCERCDAGACTSLCANPFQGGTSGTTSGDALFALRSAIGLQECVLCLCDANGDGAVTAADALGILRLAVGLGLPLQCPAPAPASTTTLPPSTTLAPTTTLPPLTTTTIPPPTTTLA